MKLNQLLKKGRQKKGLTQLQVARKLGYTSSQFVSLVENGKSKPTNGYLRFAALNFVNKEKLKRVLLADFKRDLREIFE